MKKLEPLPEYCTGCRLCVLACSFHHEQAFAEPLARLKVVGEETIWKFEPVVCCQCADAPCIEACPSLALSRDPVTGAILLEALACTGCEACVLACPYGAILFDAEAGHIRICDLCQGHPECVAACPHGAIVYWDAETGEGMHARTGKAIWFGEQI